MLFKISNFSSYELYKCAVEHANLEVFQILTLNEDRNKGLAMAAKNDAGPLFNSESSESSESWLFSLLLSFKDGSTNANIGKLLFLSRLQIIIQNKFENINNNIYNIKAPTDECFEPSFSSIRAKMAELEPIEKLELFYTSNLIYNIEDRASFNELYKCAVEHVLYELYKCAVCSDPV